MAQQVFKLLTFQTDKRKLNLLQKYSSDSPGQKVITELLLFRLSRPNSKKKKEMLNKSFADQQASWMFFRSSCKMFLIRSRTF